MLAAWLASPVPSAVAQAPPSAQAVEAAFARLAARPLWPGFDPNAAAIAIYDGRDTWLFRHPRPPAGFRRADAGNGWVYPGRHESVTANRGLLLDSVWTGTLLLNAASSAEKNAGALIHETFHTFELQRHSDWVANEVALFEYPVDDTASLAARRLETESLRRSLATVRAEESACWAASALAQRAERYARMPESAAAYERASELNEGVADYVEHRATGDTLANRFPAAEWAPDEFRLRSYTSGYALARLLDRHRPGWQAALEQRTQPLDALLAEAVTADGGARCGPSAIERTRAFNRARQDVERLAADRAQKLTDLAEAPGWTLIVQAAAGAPFFPQQFDPLNVQNLGNGRVLHTRHVRMGNDAGFVEAFGRSALTEASGRHPLFEGVRAVRITGIAGEPEVAAAGETVRVESDGIKLEFRGARVERANRTLTVRLD